MNHPNSTHLNNKEKNKNINNNNSNHPQLRQEQEQPLLQQQQTNFHAGDDTMMDPLSSPPPSYALLVSPPTTNVITSGGLAPQQQQAQKRNHPPSLSLNNLPSSPSSPLLQSSSSSSPVTTTSPLLYNHQTNNNNNSTTNHHSHHRHPQQHQSPRQRLQSQQKLHVQTNQLSNGRRKRQSSSTFPVASYPQHKKVKWISTKKIAKHQGNITFFYSATTTPTSSAVHHLSSTGNNSYYGDSSSIQLKKKVYAVLTDKKMELFETSQPFSLPDMICQSPVPTPTTRLIGQQFRNSSNVGGMGVVNNNNIAASNASASSNGAATSVNASVGVVSQEPSSSCSSLAMLASFSNQNSSASSFPQRQQQSLIMINENQVPSQYDSEHQGNVGLLGKIYLCPQICGGRVQVARSDKTSFRIILTGESPKIGPELNMNKELLTPNGSSVITPFETPMSSYFDPKSPYFPHSMHPFTSTAASSPQVDENMGTPTGSHYPVFKFQSSPSSCHRNYTSLSPVNSSQDSMTMTDAPTTVASPVGVTAATNGLYISSPQSMDLDEDGDVTMKNAMSPHDDDHNPIYGTSRGKFDAVPRAMCDSSSCSSSDNMDIYSPMGNMDPSSLFAQRNELQDILYFQAETEPECDEWVMHIQQVLSSLNNRNAYLLDEILLYIFSFLEAFDLSKSIAPASVKFYTLAQNEILWNHLYMAKWKKKDYSIMYYSAMLNVTAPYPSSIASKTNRRSSVIAPMVTWKYMYTKRYYCEKKYLKKESGTNDTISSNTNTVLPVGTGSTSAQPNENQLETLPTQSDPAEIERLRKEEEERKKKMEEERNKQISSEFLKDGNSLFNAADFEKDIHTKRLLWVFCIDQYDSCLIYNPSNWTAARNWAVALIRLEKLVNSYRGEVQAYLKMILELCVSKFEACMNLTPNNDEVLTLWAGFLSDLALKIHNPEDSDKLFQDAHQKFQKALNIKPYIGTYNDYGISFCDMAEKKIRQLKKKLHISRSATDSMGNGNTSSTIVEEDEFDAFSDDEETMDEEQIEREKSIILSCLEGSSNLYEKCLAIQPDYFHAINNMGFNQKLKIDLIRIGTKESLKSQSEFIKQERKKLVLEACDYFSRCVQIKDFVIARNNWGNILLQEAKEHEGEERFILLQQCIEQYKRAMELEPSNDGCVCRCAIAYLMSAEIRLKDLKRAQQNLSDITAHVRALQQHAKTEDLQRGLQEYMRLGQQQHEIVQQLQAQSQQMYEEASQGFLKLKNRGLSLYNLSCLNAVFEKEAEAQKYLREAFDFGYILTADKLKEDADFDSLRNKDWFQRLLHDLFEREQKMESRKPKPSSFPRSLTNK